jgi:hypothetical protein
MSRQLVVVAILIAAISGCAGRKNTETVMIPPQIDLTQYELIGVIEFDADKEGELGPLATRRFMEWARRDQGTVRILNLGSPDQLLRSVGRSQWDAEAYKAVGRKHGVRTILTGHVTVSDIRPDIDLSTTLRSGRVSAKVRAELDVELFETETGASLWNSSSWAITTLGQISVFGGKNFSFDATDPDAAYGKLVNLLADHATRDFQVTWQERRVATR